MSEQTKEIKIDVLGADTSAFLLTRGTAPEGIKIGPLRSGPLNTTNHEDVALFFIVTYKLVGPFLTDVAKDTAKELTKDWLVKFISKLNAQRIRIQGREPKNVPDMARIISEEIEIGKND